MTKKRVVITFPLDPHDIPEYENHVADFEQRGFEVILDQRYRRLEQDELIDVLQAHGAYAYVFSGERIDRKVIESCPTVRIYVKMGAGLDKVDVDACTALGVAVANTPGANSEAVAEYAVAMMLALSRKISTFDRAMRQGDFSKAFGTSMLHKTLGLIGFGNIGRLVVGLLRAFDMRVLVHDVHEDEEYARAHGCTFVPLETLLMESDFITIHAPLLDQTINMIDIKEFEMMKDGVQICNCARGGIVNEQALIAALKSGKVKGAALDVFSEEPLPMTSELYRLDTVLLSPHTAGMTYESRSRVVQMALQNIIDFSEGAMPFGSVRT